LVPEDSKFITVVGLNDLDMNYHVNNVRYIDWMTGYLREENKSCREMEIQYLSESVQGDRIYLETGQEDDRLIQTLFKNDEKIPIASSISYWE